MRSVLALFAVLSLGACAEVSKLTRGLDKPSARVVGTSLDGIDLHGVNLLFDVEVQNPYSVPLPVAKLDYALATGGQRFLSGDSDYQGTIPASGKQTLPLKARVNFSETLSLLSGLRPGAVIPYAADLGIGVDAPAIGRIRVPVEHKGELPIPTIPRFRVQDIQWQELGLTKAAGLIRLDVTNDNQFPVDLDRLAYVLKLGGKEIATSSLQKQLAFEPGQTKPLEIGFTTTPAQLGLGALELLSSSSAPFQFSGTLESMTPFGPMTFPVGDSGQTPLKR